MTIPDYYNLENVKDVYDLATHIGASFPIANALKYLIRAGHKNPDTYKEDLNKALNSIQRELGQHSTTSQGIAITSKGVDFMTREEACKMKTVRQP